MLIEIPGILGKEDLQTTRDGLAKCRFVDGKATAGVQAGGVKNNLETVPSREMMEIARIVYAGLVSNETFNQFALPRKLLPPIFSRYEIGMEYGSHSDVGMMHIDQPEAATRTDLSLTVFLSDPDDYDGGELVIDTNVGRNEFKLAAGDVVVYPCHYLHWVAPITRGVRYAAVSWVQSYVRAADHREILYELDQVASFVPESRRNDPNATTLFNLYHKLMRMWADT